MSCYDFSMIEVISFSIILIFHSLNEGENLTSEIVIGPNISLIARNIYSR